MIRKAGSEFISTFMLVFIGTGSVIADSVSGGMVTLAGISLITGAIVSFMIYIFGAWSGAHMNPAVTLSLAVGNKFLKKDILPYMISQAMGALLASSVLNLIFYESKTLGENTPTIDPWLACLFEFVITFFLMMTILVCSHVKAKYSALIIGAAVAIGIYVGGPYCGGSMNPVRSFAPAIINNNTTDLWIYLSAPFFGAIAAVVVFDKIRMKKSKKE
jgi:aquaporin Z